MTARSTMHALSQQMIPISRPTKVFDYFLPPKTKGAAKHLLATIRVYVSSFS